MTHDEIVAKLESEGIAIEKGLDKKLSLSSKLIRFVLQGEPAAAVGGDQDFDRQINLVVDGVYWASQRYPGSERLHLIIGVGKHLCNVIQACSTLIRSFSGPPAISLEVDFQPIPLRPPDFNTIDRSWMNSLKKRIDKPLPDLAKELSVRVARRSFRWYRSVTTSYWSGRVEGLEVCRVRAAGEKGNLDIGDVGQDGIALSKARIIFLDIVEMVCGKGHRHGFDFDLSDQKRLDSVATIIRHLATLRAVGELRSFDQEHYLESRVLRGAVPVQQQTKSGIKHFTAVCKEYAFQFPALYFDSDDARFVDALIRENQSHATLENDDVPYVLELKVPTGGQGEYYRHAITQAVLYREFIKNAKALHPWFIQEGLTAGKCKALVGFPKNPVQKSQKFLEAASDLFDVGYVEMPSTPEKGLVEFWIIDTATGETSVVAVGDGEIVSLSGNPRMPVLLGKVLSQGNFTGVFHEEKDGVRIYKTLGENESLTTRLALALARPVLLENRIVVAGFPTEPDEEAKEIMRKIGL